MMQLKFINWQSKRFLKLFWNLESFDVIITKLNNIKLNHPFSNLARQSINASIHYEEQAEKNITNICTHSEFINRNMQRAMTEDKARLESGLTILATIGRTAPFIGLFGTVMGIYNAIITIGANGTASLNTVAAPVGEALIMTAFGLAVAIPAVFAYNILVHSNRNFLSKLEIFSHDLYTCLNTGCCVDMKREII